MGSEAFKQECEGIESGGITSCNYYKTNTNKDVCHGRGSKTLSNNYNDENCKHQAKGESVRLSGPSGYLVTYDTMYFFTNKKECVVVVTTNDVVEEVCKKLNKNPEHLSDPNRP